ncbi:uncharacterized protein PRCAT00003053001 [Priceomyces carsonii]|uniref:uncharacterized protein n=1 Tax=Priceomyces carsonii TaxID=28549 RepID=UPI002EDAB709|nr:unnamed protein product [Priceomyces carsonii]
MTISFVPGEVNASQSSLVQSVWKNHHLIIYGSGNNLIIYSNTRNLQTENISQYLQTIYLENDLIALDFNKNNGLIGIALKSKIKIYKPANAFMEKPRWKECLDFDNHDNSLINAMQWAATENELAVASDKSLSLYHIYAEYGDWKYQKRWHSMQANPISHLRITHSANRIVTSSGNFDRLIKVWSRNCYGDQNTSFELSYLDHPKRSFVTQFKWKYRPTRNNPDEIDGSMANIKNIRGYIDQYEDDNDILYTLTNDSIIRVWASYEFGGHSHIRSWASLDLNSCFAKDEISSVCIVDNTYLQKSLLPSLKACSDDNEIVSYFKSSNLNGMDLMFVINVKGQAVLYSITNLKSNPPNQIKFEKVGSRLLEFEASCFPQNSKREEITTFTKNFISSPAFEVISNPIHIPEVIYLSDKETSNLSLLLHDRVKNTVRYEALDFSKLLSNPKSMGTILLDKLQGHPKSIRKLIRSNSSKGKENMLLSILNFPEHNYIWEPLHLGGLTHKVTVAKRFQLDVSMKGSEVDQGIWTAVLINDVEPSNTGKRRHLVVTVEKNGYIGLYDADESNYDDRPIGLKQKLQISEEGNKLYSEEPQALLFTELKEESIVVAIYRGNLTKAWKVSDSLEAINIDRLPSIEEPYKVSDIDTSISQSEKNLISVIDKLGLVRIFAVRFEGAKLSWIETFSFYTNVPNASKICGSSSINKFAVVDGSGYNLSIWNTKLGLLEYEERFPQDFGPVRDLDWTFIDSSKMKLTSNAILSVGFKRFVLLYTQLRYDYTNKIPAFAVLKKIDISEYTSHDIGDSIWLDNGYLIIACGNQFFIDDRRVKLGSNNSIDSIIEQLTVGYIQSMDSDGAEKSRKAAKDITYDILTLVRMLNGPLPIYHPQFLIQVLFMGQISVVRQVLFKLFQLLRMDTLVDWNLSLTLEEILSPKIKNNKNDSENDSEIDIFNSFNDNVADILSESLMKTSLPLITRHQQITLLSLISIVKSWQKNERSLDENGLRFLTGFKLFQNSTKQAKLSIRDINWALHSDSKEVLFGLVQDHYKSRLKWENVEQCGLPYWIDQKRLIEVVESCARNEFSESRDPSGLISLLFLAIHKRQILIGLWRTVSHPEQQKMLRFLNNDFSEPRWRSAALKNAFVLLGKHRLIDAAYFFLLGDSLKDCCNILAGRLKNVPLALAIAKVYKEDSLDVVTNIIENYIVPEVLQNGDRWTTSWIFWEMNLKEISIQALIKAPVDIIKAHSDVFSETCNKNHLEHIELGVESHIYSKDDPVLAVLFRSLRRRTVKYLRGSLGITPLEEFDFVIKVGLLYNRMGCDYLALMLIRNWNFIKYDKDENTIDWNNKKSNDLPETIEPANPINHQPPPAAAFEEPDMSAFNFGF